MPAALPTAFFKSKHKQNTHTLNKHTHTHTNSGLPGTPWQPYQSNLNPGGLKKKKLHARQDTGNNVPHRVELMEPAVQSPETSPAVSSLDAAQVRLLSWDGSRSLEVTCD